MCARAAPGALELMHFASSSSSSASASQGPKNLTITSQIQLPNTIDNPSYFHDPYAATTGKDASGYVLGGLLKAAEFPDAEHNPTSVWLVDGTTRQQKLLFQDDGRALNTSSTGVIVAIDPKGNEGRKQAWLFVTGPFSDNLVRTKVDL